MVDPYDWFLEKDDSHNCAYRRIRVGSSGTAVSVIASADRCITDWEDHPLATSIAWAFDAGITGEASINRLAAAGITGGCAPNRFCPKAQVTRGQMASFLTRALGLPPATTPNYFDDDDGSTHEASIDSLAESGITGGCAERRFCPDAPVTRAQMAAFLCRAFGTTPTSEESP
jgi:hypothetical protein